MAFVSFYAGRRVHKVPLEELNGQLQNARLIVTADLAPSLLTSYCPDLSVETIPFGDAEVTLAHSRYVVRRPPSCGSSTSQAQYWIVHRPPDKDALLLLQYLPPDAKTSTHWHRREHEWFHCLWGSCTLLQGLPVNIRQRTRCWPTSHRLAPEEPTNIQGWHIQPGVVHQLCTNRQPALNLIHIADTKAENLAQLEHQYAEWRK